MYMMTDEVTRAMNLDDATKSLALECYRESVTQFADKHFMWLGDCAFTKLRELFLSKWMIKKYHSCFEGDMTELNKETVDAFNYANIHLGMHSRFIKTAKELVSADKRVSDDRLKELSDDMMFLAVFEKQAA
jgi:hypothetical protein